MAEGRRERGVSEGWGVLMREGGWREGRGGGSTVCAG